MEKINRLRKQGENIDLPLVLGIHLKAQDLLEAGLLERDEQYPEILDYSAEGRKVLEKLRCRVSANGIIYEASHNMEIVPNTEDQAVIFSDFYMRELGPLPSIKDEEGYDGLEYNPFEGYELRFSADPLEHAQIGLYFDLLKD